MSDFVISCGGTGGHLSPGIALAEKLAQRGRTCALVVSQKAVDSRLLKKYPNFEYTRSPATGLRWGLWATPKFALSQLRAVWRAWREFGRRRPAAVVAFGGFVSFGICAAARLRGIPVVLHEANRVPGKAIRLLSVLARRVYLPAGVALSSLPPQTLRECGFPLRREMARMPKALAREKLGICASGKLLLVLGGSQGAKQLNDWVVANFDRLAEEGISVFCITGLGKGEGGYIEKCAASGETARAYFRSFCDDMPALLSAADLVVSRAGAGSLAEFARFRLPAILVPLATAADNHQSANARFFEAQGAAVCVPSAQIDRLFREVLDLIFNDWMLKKFARNLERLDREDAAETLASDLLALTLPAPPDSPKKD